MLIQVSEWVIKFNSLSGDSGEWGPYSPYKPYNRRLFSATNLALAGFPLTNGENWPSPYYKMFNLRLCNTATIRYSLLKFGQTHLCGIDYDCFSPHCCKCKSFDCTAAIRCGTACHGPHSNSLYSGSEHNQFDSPRLVKREAGFPNPRQMLIGSYQLWCVNDSPYCWEYIGIIIFPHIDHTQSTGHN